MIRNDSSTHAFKFSALPISIICTLVSVLGGSGPAQEGRRYQPYEDSSGVWTVCAGVTSAVTQLSRTYTAAECQAIETRYVTSMTKAMSRCVHGAFTWYQVVAWAHFAYNVGVNAFCQSTAAKKINAGEQLAACAEITKWVYVDGKDCRNQSNNCTGIVVRRAWERALCEKGILQ